MFVCFLSLENILEIALSQVKFLTKLLEKLRKKKG